jgi:hypothetical protein
MKTRWAMPLVDVLVVVVVVVLVADMVTTALAVDLELSVEIAVMVTVPAVLPAVKKPAELMVPPEEALQVTGIFALNWSVAFGLTVATAGEM